MKKLLFAIMSCLALCGFGSPKKTNMNTNTEFTNERRYAIESQFDSVVTMLNDSTLSAQELCGPLKRLADTLSVAIRYDALFETNKEYRTWSRQLAYRLSTDKRGFDSNCFYDFIWIPYLWEVDVDDSVEVMFTTFFRSSWESNDRMANVILAQYDGDEKRAFLVVTNYIDTVINDLTLKFRSGYGKWSEVPLDENLTDYSDVESGIIRVMVSFDDMIQSLKKSDVMEVSYRAGNGELVEMTHVCIGSDMDESLSFEGQLKECPRLCKPSKFIP